MKNYESREKTLNSYFEKCMMFGENDDKEKKNYKLSIPVKKKVDEK